jgi:HK97 family phage major capsid protein
MFIIRGEEFPHLQAIRDRVIQLDREYDGCVMPPQARALWNSLNETLAEGELEARRSRVRELARGARPNGRDIEAGVGYGDVVATRDAPGAHADALRAIERHVDSGGLRSEAADRLDDLVRRHDPMGIDSAYLAAVGDSAYMDAFGKILAYGSTAPVRMSAQELDAVQRVVRAEQMRAMAVGTGSAGGYAVPWQLDPTIMLTSNGAINPLREAATVKTISSSEWRGITSAGVTSNYGPEASEVADDGPTLARPSIVAERWTSFVPFSIEIGQDWAGLQVELARLMADSKDALDAEKLLSGAGHASAEPQGLLVGLGIEQRVQTAAVGTLAPDDIYQLKNSLGARFQPNASYLAAGAIIDRAYRFVPAGSTTEAPLVSPTRDAILGKALRELSTMSASTATGNKVMVYGDLAASFVIVERLGLQVELVNHLFGANRRPTGERGLLAIGRTGSGVVNPAAARYLEIK